MSQLKFEIDVMNKLFPFCVVTDNEGNIVYTGTSMQKLLPTGAPRTFDDVFAVDRPKDSQFAKIRDLTPSAGEMIVLRMRLGRPVNLMGQMLPIAGTDYRLFILNLVVQDADELTDLNLDFNDFAIHDPIFDYLMLLQTQRRAIRQADEANRKLQESHGIAVKASLTKSQFLANMSHEIRTPMNGLLGMARILQDTDLDAEQRDYLDTLLTSGETMLALINDILDLSKIEAGYIQLSPEQVDVQELIAEVRDTVLPMAQKKSLEVEITFTGATPKITADKMRLRQVILNLVGNAVKFTLKGSVGISTEIAKDGMTIRVRDSGIGMSAEVLAQIFSPFVQGDSSMTKKFEGTGLGLSICKKLVDAMGGRIRVTSQEGVGSEFTLEIPLAA